MRSRTQAKRLRGASICLPRAREPATPRTGRTLLPELPPPVAPLSRSRSDRRQRPIRALVSAAHRATLARASRRSCIEAKRRTRGLCPGHHPFVVRDTRNVLDSNPCRPTR
jgi:hypothetical protein